MKAKNAMTTRERCRAILNFEPADRLPILEWAGWWGETIDRWRKEGLPANLNGSEIQAHLGMDIYYQGWYGPFGPQFPWTGKHGVGPVATMDDYEKVLPHLYRWPVIDPNQWKAWAEKQKAGDVAVWFTIEGPFWYPRTLFGIERHLYAFYDEPELMHRMIDDIANWQVRVIDAVCEHCTPDFMTFAEDMSYNHGPMLSQELFEEFMTPYYQRVTPMLKERGIISIVDSDGDITVPAAWFEDAGVQGILPLERQAGVDVARVRKDHPRMRFIGCYDKMVMNKGEAAMRREFERLMPVARQGGLIISCDHQTPPGVSFEDYKLYLKLFREYAEQI